MPTKYVGSLFALAVVAALVQLPTAPSSSPMTKEILPRQFAPMKFHSRRLDGGVNSNNWSGYAVLGSAFTNATASWKEPTVNCSKTPNTYAAFWVGIDGYSDTTVEQTGTLAVCSGSTASYYAWYEFYPAEPIEVISGMKISPGDKISAEVTYSGSEFTLKITDEATKKSFTKKGTSSTAERSSAEWIVEAPSSSSGILPLSDFGTASFGEDNTEVNDTNYATDSTVTGPIGDFGSNVEKITMINGSTKADESVPTALSTDGTSFKVSWKSE